MRRILSTIFAILLTASAFAQSHGNHIMVGVGGSYPQGVEATLAYEHETEYHNACFPFMLCKVIPPSNKLAAFPIQPNLPNII